MISIQYLFNSMNDFEQELSNVDREKECLVQIFTTILHEEECVSLAKQIKELLPLAHIVGTSVNALIYHGLQYEQNTMITIEQYTNCQINSHLLSIEDKDAKDIAAALEAKWGDEPPKLLRLFLGAYYPKAHQLMDQINLTMSTMQVVGGMSGELYQSQVLPFVFNHDEAIACGLVCAGLKGDFSTYNRINTAHERISAPYTITKAEGTLIYEIEEEPAQDWLQKNLGFKSSQEYDSWEEIANNDPLVRFQIALEDYSKATRFIHYNKAKKQISQYFTQLDSGTKFRISYTSPSKCVEECKETCIEIMDTPIEQLFCYSCLFRKLYLTNCAQWELSPYHKNPISGVFLLGEFGYHNGCNEVLNGSCVLSGICEKKQYLQVDLSYLDQLEKIQIENEGLFDFILNKKNQTKTSEHKQLLTDVMDHERTHQPDFYRYIDTDLGLSNMLQYELDKAKYGFDKLCLSKIENADILISFIGQAGYVRQIKEMIRRLETLRSENQDDLFVYSASSNSFIIAANATWTEAQFIELIHRVERYCEAVQENFLNTPIIIRYIVVTGSKFLVEQAYEQAELHKNSQSRIIIHSAQAQDKAATRRELECITLIQNAIAQNRVIPYYQGLYNNRTKKIDAYEALMRICDADGNILSPFLFMDTAKKYRLYLDLNLKMFEAVLDNFSTIDCAVCINLCAHDIDSPKFRNTLRQRLKTFHKPSNISFEILEDEYFSDTKVLKDFLAELRSYGVKISIDDFGSGYSNLLELIKIQPDYLKIDGEIIREAHLKRENEIIVSVISTLAQQLSLDLVAEFVENEEIQKIVEKYEISHSQGYLFSKPQPFSAIYQVEKKVLTHNTITKEHH